MKSPDITLCLQAIHFFVAYYVLRTYVFYPAMKILIKQEEQDKKLHDAIEHALEKKEKAQKYKQSRWLNIKQTLHSLVPDSAQKLLSLQFSKEKFEDLYDKQIDVSPSDRKEVKKIVRDSLSDINT